MKLEERNKQCLSDRTYVGSVDLVTGKLIYTLTNVWSIVTSESGLF